MLDQLQAMYKQLVKQKLEIDGKIDAVKVAIMAFEENTVPHEKERRGRPKGSKAKVKKVKRTYKKRKLIAEAILSEKPESEASHESPSIAERIKALMEKSMGPVGIESVVAFLGDCKPSSIKQTMKILYAKGEIKRVGKGIYALATHGAAVAA